MFSATLKRIVETVEGKLAEVSIPITAHPSKTGVVIVNSHGLGGSKDGYNNKYMKIANLLQNLGVGSVVRYQSSLYSFAFQDVDMDILLLGNLRAVIEYVLNEATIICGLHDPEILLAGFSAGASTSVAVTYEYPQVTKMLLIAPSADIDKDTLKKGLAAYKGELYITLGDNDQVVGTKTAQTLAEYATKAKLKKVVVVPNCDHQFTGERNGRILSKAYLWAFKGDKTYPSPEGGTELY